MPTITDWLMVIITVIYVVATILICKFNNNSAKAAQEQVAEMKKQRADEKINSALPWFLVSVEEFSSAKGCKESQFNEEDIIQVVAAESEEASSLHSYRLVYSVRNIGHGTATKSRYTWDCPDGTEPPVEPLFNRSLMPGESYSKTVLLKFGVPKDAFHDGDDLLASASIIFKTFDIYDSEYTQGVELFFRLYKDGPAEVEISNGVPKKS